METETEFVVMDKCPITFYPMNMTKRNDKRAKQDEGRAPGYFKNYYLENKEAFAERAKNNYQAKKSAI